MSNNTIRDITTSSEQIQELTNIILETFDTPASKSLRFAAVVDTDCNEPARIHLYATPTPFYPQDYKLTVITCLNQSCLHHFFQAGNFYTERSETERFSGTRFVNFYTIIYSK